MTKNIRSRVSKRAEARRLRKLELRGRKLVHVQSIEEIPSNCPSGVIYVLDQDPGGSKALLELTDREIAAGRLRSPSDEIVKLPSTGAFTSAMIGEPIEFHLPGCDTEVCPKCGKANSCSCTGCGCTGDFVVVDTTTTTPRHNRQERRK